ncbi:hypothetical protein AXZ77_3109 [Thioclava sp. ES.031]|uniref:hypothetical protein n=1 Tax=Thioclava sp. ES.031 TaxID=1798203 RepID=UPI000C014B52|nr:hypothetical protein [Thioclava sp. ES.031]PFG64469.1 hypothetical protein AXZ77_3109 [Thioclava sp. ES.031]
MFVASYQFPAFPILAAAGIALASTGAAFAQSSAENPALRWDQAECLRDHATDYFERHDFPSILFVGFCEDGIFDPSAAEIAKGTSRNSAIDSEGLPRLKSGAVIPANPKAAVLVLTRAQLECLHDEFDRVARKQVAKLDETTEIPVAELDFSGCPQ